MVDEEQTQEVQDPTAEKRAEMGDVRVPSSPLRPADVPPAPLTKSARYNKEDESEEQ